MEFRWLRNHLYSHRERIQCKSNAGGSSSQFFDQRLNIRWPAIVRYLGIICVRHDARVLKRLQHFDEIVFVQLQRKKMLADFHIVVFHASQHSTRASLSNAPHGAPQSVVQPAIFGSS